MTTEIALLLLTAYLIGSIPFGLLLTHLCGKGDVRQFGSGNIGATNVTRVAGKKIGLLTLLLDGGKGYLAIYISIKLLMQDDVPWQSLAFGPVFIYTIGLGTIIGHCFPIWLKFKGGKGVATAFGTIYALSWPLGVICTVTWLFVFLISKYSALAAIITLILMPIYAVWLNLPTTLGAWIILVLISLIVLIRHNSNIKNLLAGTEHKFGKKK